MEVNFRGFELPGDQRSERDFRHFCESDLPKYFCIKLKSYLLVSICVEMKRRKFCRKVLAGSARNPIGSALLGLSGVFPNSVTD